MKRLLPALAAFLFCAGAQALFEDYEFSSPENALRYEELTNKLRCLVCQNQSLADSNADLATDLRIVVFDMVEAGKPNDEIVDFLLERYGDFVLYDPPLRAGTLLLWAAPFALLVLQIAIIVSLARKKRKP